MSVRSRASFRLLVCLFILLLAVPVLAQETGSISGVVQSGDGSPLPGVVVTASGPLLPGGRTATSASDGSYSILRLPPGPYTVSAELSGMGNTRREVIVAVARDTQVGLTLSPATVQDEITVSAVAPVVDVRSTEIQVNYTHEFIENLPVPRTYKGLFQLAPGVSENDRLTPNAGGSRMDNNFLIDGINITNPHFGDILPNITELDFEEVAIKRGGITAEFGRTGGMVVNAVTKSGTNELAGEARLEYQPNDFVSDSENPNVSNTPDRSGVAASLGGPLLRDHLWYYGSASFPRQSTTERTNQFGSIPDLEVNTDEYFLKFTSQPVQNHYLNISGRSREVSSENEGLDVNVSPTVRRTTITDYLLATLGWTWNTTENSFLELKLNYNKEENSVDPATDLGYRPAFNAARPDLVGRFTSTDDRRPGGANRTGQLVGGTDLAINDQNFERNEARATFQSFQDWFGVSHDLRAGVTYDENEETLNRRANGWGVITWNAATQQFSATYVSQQPPHTGRGEALGLFAQDQFTLGQRTTIVAGVLVNRDTYYGEALGSTPGTKREVKLLTFDWDQQIQPRLGVSFVPSLERGDKLYFNYGRYFNTENKSLVRAASPTRIFSTTARFDAAGNFISETAQANTQSKTIDPGLDPQFTDEFVAGYARPFGRGWAAEIWGMYREVGDIMEDISRDGLGNGPFRVAQLPDAYREYTAATLQVSRRPIDGRWLGLALEASYTWSRLEGNWDIDFSSGDSPFYNSSFLGDGPGVLLTDNRDGLMRGDRTHVAKVFATVEPVERLRVGTYLRYQSGAAWEARSVPAATVSSASHIAYLERAGSRRMDSWFNTDLLASYEFPLSIVGLELEARMTNVFDEQAQLAVDDRLLLGRAMTPNPDFGTTTTYSTPRSFVLSAIIRY
ncbi:MAG TPA: carboxypeptidase regulatory-like domain-containing protein [Thermoanaerobaculia bacterium]|nr:carboxypeptidase regulatory-like domain-containing protein [Thermoanaerobaculia bacterium]